MSRIGNLPVFVPQGVDVQIGEQQVVAKGPKGLLSFVYDSVISLERKDSVIILKRKDELKHTKALHGLYRQKLNNIVEGVHNGFSKLLVFTGVGYRAEVKNDSIIVTVGYSMPIEYILPEGIQAKVEDSIRLTIFGINKELVGKVASEIRGLRPVEPYKGKGIRYSDEHVIRKVGKSGMKK